MSSLFLSPDMGGLLHEGDRTGSGKNPCDRLCYLTIIYTNRLIVKTFNR
ncbi:MAG: hypothetical protein KME22_16245 [Hassallia sp. WJT32-NPBG1]|nr:hypothetical protein [Hassallia sp. WJT32-NPBG1]